MKIQYNLRLAVLVVSTVAWPGQAFAEDPTINRMLASQCAQCHGTNGHAVGDMDGLAGDGDLLEDLLDMVREDHIEDIMEHQAHGYTYDQMRRIAAYYGGLPESDGDGQPRDPADGEGASDRQDDAEQEDREDRADLGEPEHRKERKHRRERKRREHRRSREKGDDHQEHEEREQR
jgi:cytochrome subunit of sulfide dehydrogenase